MLILMTEKICYNSIQITGDGRRVYMNAIGIILIVILLGFAGTGLYFYFKVKRHVKEITREAYGTDDVGKAFKMAKKDMTETPKSISRMTSLMLPKIKKDFPEFNYDEMKVRAKNLVKGYLLALMNQDIKELPEGNPDLKKKLQLAIENQKNEGVRVYYNNIKFHDIQISRYENRAGVCRILFQTSLECIHYVLDKDENVVSGVPSSDTSNTSSSKKSVVFSSVGISLFGETSVDAASEEVVVVFSYSVAFTVE